MNKTDSFYGILDLDTGTKRSSSIHYQEERKCWILDRDV